VEQAFYYRNYLQQMKYLLTFLLLSFFAGIIVAQPLANPETHASPVATTYAIVIGISDYKDPDIPKLSFSNRDAEVFSDFLMSAPGGSVPKQNIKLLTDSAATIVSRMTKCIFILVAMAKWKMLP
jgi:hypothetical protein